MLELKNNLNKFDGKMSESKTKTVCSKYVRI